MLWPEQLCQDMRQARRRCRRPASDGGFCGYHAVRRELEDSGESGSRDRFYDEKIRLGLISPPVEEFSEAETSTLLAGRYRGDGRRLDQWVVYG